MSVEKIELAPGYSISRIINGGWQLSEGHSPKGKADPIEDMFALVKAGITTFDCADIYTGVEELIGQFRVAYKNKLGVDPDIKVHTKFVPDYDKLATINKAYVEMIIDRSLKRLQQERLDMVQYAWWNYDIPGWVETGLWLQELQQAGKIDLISTTNFNTKRTRKILDAGVKLASTQVQYSLLDHRPEKELIELCAANDIHLLCYGTIAGGFLSERWLGKTEPHSPFENRSLIKYKLMIDQFGGWKLFQDLLLLLKTIADKHHVGVANVASRYVLSRKQVAGIIIGARNTDHIDDNLRTFDLKLDQADLSEINKVLSQSNEIPGDVFGLERIKDGPHGRIMKYNLNTAKS